MRNKTWRWIILLIVLVLIVGGGIWWILRPPPPAPPDLSWKNVEKAGKLVIATDASYPPLANVGPDGQLAGFDIDVAKELCRRLDLQPEFVNTDLGGMVDGLVAKKFDVIISGWIPAEEHKKMLRYSLPYFDAGQVIVINTARGGPGSEQELRRGKPGGQTWKVAAEQGSTAEIMLRDWLKTPVPRGQPTPTPILPAPYTLHLAMTPEEAIANVASGSVDAAIVDHLTALQLTANHPELSIAGKPLTDEPYVVAGRIAGAELMKHINTALQAMIADGWLKQAQQRWLAQPPPP